ncbi:hypothetical protein VTN96DRAFT_5803 [Rasamsonia emersonii]
MDGHAWGEGDMDGVMTVDGRCMRRPGEQRLAASARACNARVWKRRVQCRHRGDFTTFWCNVAGRPTDFRIWQGDDLAMQPARSRIAEICPRRLSITQRSHSWTRRDHASDV